MLTKSSRLALVAVVAIAAIVGGVIVTRSRALPAPGSATYETATRAFYKGLAELEVGLLDDAKREFTTVTTTVPKEPAAWANLGLAHLRLGELDAAEEPITRAMTLAPENAGFALLAGRMEIARGRLDEGVAHIRRAVELAPNGLEARFALAEELDRSAAPDADAQALAQLDELTKLTPQNMAVLLERSRVAAKTKDAGRLNESLASLMPMAAGWPAMAAELYQALQQSLEAKDFSAAQRNTAFLRNVLLGVPAFRQDVAAVRTPAELIAEPVNRFIALVSPSAMPAEPDLQLAFAEEAIAKPSSLYGNLFVLPPDSDGATRIFSAVLSQIRELTGSFRVDLSASTDVVHETPTVAVADWNNDFRRDIITVTTETLHVLLQQADGTFLDQTPRNVVPPVLFRAVWVADVEMDGDVDIIASPLSGAVVVLRNDANGEWTPLRLFEGQQNVIGFEWADVDGDNDPDAVFLEQQGGLAVFANGQAGSFTPLPVPSVRTPSAMTVADIDSDGRFEIVILESSGTIRGATFDGQQWDVRQIATWPQFEPRLSERLFAADFDNNGAIDLLGVGASRSRLWLGDTSRQLQLTDVVLPLGSIVPAGDLNADGRLDLVAVAAVEKFLEPTPPGQPPVRAGVEDERRIVRLLNKGTKSYHWKQIGFRAQETAGDQRINSFGAGGYIEARSGPLFQKQPLTGGPVHIGLGTQSTIDVARIVWPNGVPQAEFGTSVDDTVVIEQRLKGSCPWVFTWDGTRMVFVTDFLWRSPLGLRINAQDTAGVTQTEDWVRLRGDQLVPRDGRYDVRITAELWETHFFDHVSLMAVDHPDGTEVFVDERFSPAAPPALAVQALAGLRPVPRATDERGTDVTAVVAARDGKYLSTFTRGRFQGIADDHFVEIDLAGIARDDVLVANGWIYPTDSSINVAIAQAGIAPRGLSLEAQNADGSWRVVNPDLGFPAGKNKTVLIDLKGAAGTPRIRLRTNLEIYWDSLSLGRRASSTLKTTRIQASSAKLRYRGFSNTVSPRGDAPETPEYDRLASTSPRWRDLIGYHTRFGDVRELVDKVDDRYVIMNAGDEMQLQFAEVPSPAAGWRRDFVLIGDGWEKDGDYNTGFSQTVLPLPSHDKPNYGAGTTSLALEDDPVYQRHRDDWQRYHTRYVTPERFLNGLKPSKVN